MDDIYAKILSKKTKVENALTDLHNEIYTIWNFLQRLKNYSTEIVRELNSKKAPDVYFREFMDVNSFLLKYLSLLTEINCKFEMLEISHNRPTDLVSVSGNILSSEISFGIIDKSDSQFDLFESFTNFDICESREELKKINLKESNHSSISFSNVKLSEVKELTKNKPLTSPQITFAATSKNSSYLRDPRIRSDSEVQSKIKSSNAESDEVETLTKETSLDKSFLESGYLTESLMFNEVKVQQSKSQLQNTDVPIAEIVPTKICEPGFDLKTIKDLSSPLGLIKRDIKNCTEKTFEEIKNENEIKPVVISSKLGDEYEVTIEHIQSPSEFYVYVQNSQLKLFSELLLKLKQYHRSGIKIHKCGKAELMNSYVLFYSKCDEMWCRAKVINWCLNYKDDFIKIFLLDYGEYKCVSLDDVEIMPEHFKKYPAFPRRCHLYGILPCDLEKDAKTLSWGKQSTEKMKSLTETSKILKIKITPPDNYHPAESLPVTLWLLDEEKESINELLVKSKCAVFKSHYDSLAMSSETLVTKDFKDENFSNWNPMKEDYEALDNCYDLDINDPASYIYGYVGKDYERVCRFFARTGHCYKGKACRKEHKKLDHLGFTTDQEEIYKNAFNSLAIPQINSIVRVQITCLLKINKFCCILRNQKWSSEEENLETLSVFMNQPQNVQVMRKLLIPPSTGQIVAARYSQDCLWYRAKILESQPEIDAYTVLFVDYGNKETLSLSHIRAIEERYLHLPFQAVNCSIFGIEQNPEISLEETMNFLNKQIVNRNISIEIVSKLPGEDVNLLVHLFDENGKNLGAELKAHGYAVYKKEILISSDSVSIPG